MKKMFEKFKQELMVNPNLTGYQFAKNNNLKRGTVENWKRKISSGDTTLNDSGIFCIKKMETIMKNHINIFSIPWEKIQLEYDSGKTQRELIENYTFLNFDTFVKAKELNLFKPRDCNDKKFRKKQQRNGSRRQKLEIYLEKSLKKLFKFEILFNNRSIIGLELDIYIPSKGLAFEINGIFHHKPIFGEKKYLMTLEQDKAKKELCYQKGIKLVVIDVLTDVRGNDAEKYLNIISSHII